jgi:hypothetical protein
MALGDRWEDCMHTMGMPTPAEAWESATEAVEKLHEVDIALGGLGLLEAAEQLESMGIVVEGAGEAGALTVSWWVGNAIGCTVTAAVGDQIVDAIDYLVQPVVWSWVEAKMNEVSYPIPTITLPTDEETTTRSSSTAQDDPPPNPVLDQGSGEADWVRYLQGLLVQQYGYQLDVDGDFGPATAAAVRDFKQRHDLDSSSSQVDQYTWRALEAAPTPP